MLVLLVPALTPEIRWICDVLFRHFLGLDCALLLSPHRNFRLLCGTGIIDMPDVFFADAYRQRPSALAKLFPALPLPVWDPARAGLSASLCSSTVPIVFGVLDHETTQQACAIRLPLDILGTAFFMLSRYEELDSLIEDAHGRFPDQAALAVRACFDQRPIVDEYVAILWAAIHKMCPNMARGTRHARTLISCDVDLPVDPASASSYRLGRRMAARIIRQRSVHGLSTMVGNYLAVRRGENERDPYLNALDWIMEVNAHEGNRVAFNLIPIVTDRAMDRSIDLQDPRLLDLMQKIHVRGHEIGIHPGYNTFHHPNAMQRSVGRLRTTMARLDIGQSTLGGRQHYLRWRAHVTPQLWEENGLDYDSSLGYADRPGFRCGTCREFPMFDLVARRALRLRQRPLLSMEPMRYHIPACRDKALDIMTYYRQVCRRYHGDFTLLWHNSNFEHALERDTYRDILAA
jgi:hypothetical protein